MIVVIRSGAGEDQVQEVIARAESLGLAYHLSRGAERAVLILDGGEPAAVEQALTSLPAVEQVLPLTRPYRLAAREVHPADTLVQVAGLLIGGDAPTVIAGSAGVVADAAALDWAVRLRDAGAGMVRTGVYRPATEMYGTAQVDGPALERLDGVRRASGLPVATEVLAAADVPAIARHADVLIVGAAHMQERSLLLACGWSNRPIILQRAESAQVQEWLQAADQLLAAGNRQVILCERGIRTYEPATRHTLDLSAVPLVRRVSHLPVLVDPSHGSGLPFLVEPLAQAAIAAGAHGLLVEVRGAGVAASADGEAAIDIPALGALVARVRALHAALAG